MSRPNRRAPAGATRLHRRAASARHLPSGAVPKGYRILGYELLESPDQPLGIAPAALTGLGATAADTFAILECFKTSSLVTVARQCTPSPLTPSAAPT
jgi:hypothetical protein